MGYNYRESGYGSCDYLIVTKKEKKRADFQMVLSY